MKKFDIKFWWGRHSGIRPIIAISRYMAQMAILDELTEDLGIEHETAFLVLAETDVKEK